MHQYVIVGNGLAGVTAAQHLTKIDPAAQIHILGAEPYLYYRRPMLWKHIAGEMEESDLYFKPAEWYEGQNIHVHLNALAVSVDPQAHIVTLADGRTLGYDRLLIATGSTPSVPPIKGSDKKGVFTLRTLDDAHNIKAEAANSQHVIVIGGGLLGLETARSLLAPNRAVSVLEFMPHLLPRQLSADGAAVLQHLLEDIGLEIVTGAATAAILGDSHVTGVQLEDDRIIEGQVVIISAGIRPRIELAEKAQLRTNRGVIVDQHMRTSDPDIYAAGDVAEAKGTIYGIIPAAMEQARVAAANMVKPGSTAYVGTLPSTTLKVVGIALTCLGNSNATDNEGWTIVTQMDQAAGVFRKLVLKDGRITGAILMGDVRDARAIQQLIQNKTDVSAFTERLLAPDLDLAALARGEIQDSAL